MFKKLGLYINTIRYLKFSQIVWQCIRRIYHPKISMKVENLKLACVPGKWRGHIERQHQYFDRGYLTLINESVPCDRGIWKRSLKQSKTWRYHLHCFNSILSNDKKTVSLTLDMLASWIDECKPYAEDAWDPYPISIRIGNLIKYQLSGGTLSEFALHSLYLQARYLNKVPEYHLSGNHLLENAKALVFAGMFFAGEEANHWRQKGMKILRREIPKQICRDGGYFELSPMYHAMMQELLLDIYNLMHAYQVEFPTSWFDQLQNMRAWLKVMTHPNGEIAFFNDAALGVAPSTESLESYAKQLALPDVRSPNEGIVHLKASGYIRLQKGPAVLLLDCARVGPDYQPAHAHSDTLSFELSINNKRCIVNSGTSSYLDKQLRDWQRSTAAHSTVEVNQKSSSEPWGHFRMARRAYPIALSVSETKNGWSIRCSHTGYLKSSGCQHTRTWHFSDDKLSIIDECDTPVDAISRYYLHPEVIVENNILKLDGDKIKIESDSKIGISGSEYFPEFGKSVSSHVMSQHFSKQASMQFFWS